MALIVGYRQSVTKRFQRKLSTCVTSKVARWWCLQAYVCTLESKFNGLVTTFELWMKSRQWLYLGDASTWLVVDQLKSSILNWTRNNRSNLSMANDENVGVPKLNASISNFGARVARNWQRRVIFNQKNRYKFSLTLTLNQLCSWRSCQVSWFRRSPSNFEIPAKKSLQVAAGNWNWRKSCAQLRLALN